MKKRVFGHEVKKALTLCLILSLVCAVIPAFASCNQPTEPAGTDTVSDNGSLADIPSDVESVTEQPTDPDLTNCGDYLATAFGGRFALTRENTPYFVGRWFEKDIEGAAHRVTLTDGAYCCFAVTGAAELTVDFTVITTKEEPYFAYIIDGNEPVRQHITEPLVALPDNGVHLIRIVADGMTETEGKWEEEKGFALKGISTSQGGKIFGVKPTGKVLYFYGDSITEGIRALNMNATSDGNSATHAYSWQCAEKLGATLHNVGYGATGLIQTGSFNTMGQAIDMYSQARPVNDSLMPDVIIINHGTNDASHSDADFEAALRQTLTHLSEKYPGVPVVYLIPFNQSKATVIRNVMKDVEGGHVIETRKWHLNYTDGVHPSSKGATTAGENLANELIELFGQDFFS